MFLRLNYLMLLLSALLFVHCGPHRYPSQLVLLDSLADHELDSAVTLMQQLKPVMSDASEYDRRYFQLLCVKVADKADLPLPSDTVAWDIVRYYEEDGDSRLLPMAYYYAARICRTQNDAPQALDYLLKANELLDDSRPRLKGVVNSQMGYLFSQQKLYRNAVDAFKEAYRCDSINNDTTGMILNLRDIGFDSKSPYVNYDYYLRAFNLAKQQHNDDLIADISAQLANSYYKQGIYDSAEVYIMTAINYNDPQDQNAVNAIAAKIFEKTRGAESALYHYKKLTQLNSIYAKEAGYKGLFEYTYKRGLLDSAFVNFQQYKKSVDSIQEITATEIVAQMHASYNYQLREKENIKLKEILAYKDKILFIATLIALVIIASISIPYYRMRSRDIKLKANLEKLQSLQEEAKIKNSKQISENLATIRELEKRIEKLGIQDEKQKEELTLLKEKLEHKTELGIIAQKEELETLSRLEDVPVYQLVKEANCTPKEKVRCLTDKEWVELCKAIDTFYPEFKKRLYGIYPLKMQEYHICILIKLEISPIIIAALTAHSKESITATRRRLYYKSFGQKGTPKDWDEFVLSA